MFRDKLLGVALTMLLLALPAHATLQNGTDTELGDPPLALDGTWVVLDEIMAVGSFFTGTFTYTSALPIEFTITDVFVVSDQLEVYLDGGFVSATSVVPDWDVLGLAGPFVSPPWTADPDTALADGRFSAAVLVLPAGSHGITIRDIHIPPTTAGGSPFIDGTVAFKATVIPAPGAALLGVIGLGTIAWIRRRLL